MAQINTIDKNTNNIAKSNVGGMLFPANNTDHQLLMAYYLKWGLHLSDGESLDTTEDVINYLLTKIDDLYNKISDIEDQTEYTVVVSSSSNATCDTSKIKKSGGTITITPNSGYKITNVIPNNCTITHINNSNKYQITNVTGNITLTINTQVVDIKINGENLSNLTITREKNNTLNSITQNAGKFSPKSIAIGETSTITPPTSLTLKYGNNEGSVDLTFSGTDKNSTPDVIIADPSKLAKFDLDSNGVTLTSKGVIGNTTVTIKFTDVNNLYEKVFNINVTIENANSSSTITSGWTYNSKNTSVATISDTTISGIKTGTSIINVQYNGKEATLGTLTVKEEEVTINYYWYVGQENPASMTSISPIVTENGVTGWRETGSVLTATYEYNSTDYPISSNPSQNSMWYYALPENTGLGAFDAQNENYAVNPISSVTINGVKYNIFEGGASRKFNALTIKNK